MESKNSQPIFPWYKERLRTKYLKAQTNKISSPGSCCRFVNTCLDDFSDCSSVLPQRGVSLDIFHDTPTHNSQKQRKSIFKEHACLSKQMTQKQIRREYVAAVEEKLKQHPQIKYLHYKDHISPELFDEVVSVLDPDMCANSASALPTPTRERAKDEEEPSKEEVQGTKHNGISPAPRNPYTLQMRENVVSKKDCVVKVNRQDMKAATKLFTKWFVPPDKETNVTELATLGQSDSDSSSPTFPIQVEDAISSSGRA